MPRRAAALVLFGAVLGLPALAEPTWQRAYDFAVAQALAQEGAYKQALEAFRRVVEQEPEDAFVRLEYAELLFRLRRDREAAEQAAVARELAPEDPDVLRLYGQVQVRLAEEDPEALDRAREAFERLRDVDPQETDPLVTLGQIHLSQGRPVEAVKVFADLLEARPADRLAISFLVDALEQADRAAEAEERLEVFLQRDPGFRKAWLSLAGLKARRGDHDGAAEVLGGALAAGHGDAELRRQLGVELYQADKPGEALAALDEVLEERPADFGALYLRVLSLAELGRDEEALERLGGLREERPDSLDLAVLESRLLRRVDRRDEAELTLERARDAMRRAERPAEAAEAGLELARLRADAEDWAGVLEATVEPGGDAEVQVSTLLLRAEALFRLKRGDEALELLQAHPAAETETRVEAKVAEILLRMERGEEARRRMQTLLAGADVPSLLLAAEVFQNAGLYADAIAPLERALASEPESLEILFRLAASFERNGQNDRAEARFRELLRLDPDFAPALNYLGYMWADRGENLSEALDLVSRAVELEPDNGAYVDSLGWAYYRLGQLSEARSHLERAAELVPDDAVVIEHLGDVYRALGEVEEAREQYRRALDLSGENVDQVRRKLEELGGRD